jgi:predicted aspartyl protease
MRVMMMIVWLVVSLVAAGCQVAAPREPARSEVTAPPGEREVAFELAGPGEAAMVVPVMINGQGPFDFVFDTGATMTCIDHTLSTELGLDDQRDGFGVAAGVGAAGAIRLVRLESFELGPARAEDMQACVIDLRHARKIGVEIDGLLGLNFMRQYRVTLDFGRNIVVLDEPDEV